MSRYEVHLYDTDSAWSCQKSWSEQQHCASWLTLHRPAAGPTAGAGVGRVVSFYAFPQWWGISRSAPQLAIKKPALLIRPARCTATLSMKHCPAHLPNRTCSEKEEKKVPGKNHKKDEKKNGLCCTLAVWSVYTWSEAQSEAEKGEIGKKGEKTMNLIASTLHNVESTFKSCPAPSETTMTALHIKKLPFHWALPRSNSHSEHSKVVDLPKMTLGDPKPA